MDINVNEERKEENVVGGVVTQVAEAYFIGVQYNRDKDYLTFDLYFPREKRNEYNDAYTLKKYFVKGKTALPSVVIPFGTKVKVEFLPANVPGESPTLLRIL